MKKITASISLLLLLALPVTGMAQGTEGFENQNGYEASRESGIVSKLMRWEKFGVKRPDQRVYDPQQRLRNQLGIKEPNNLSTNADNYEFFGGESYKGNNVPYASVTDAAGNTYITGGSTNETKTEGDFFTIKVSPSGAILWEARETTLTYAVEYGLDILIDNNGDIVVTGLKWNGNDMDIRTKKYTSGGNTVWESVYNSTFEGVDIPAAMVTGTDGSIYITGISYSGTSVDYLTLKYNADGTLAWEARNNPAGEGSWNEATALALDNGGNVIVTGYSPNPDGWLNYHTIKYSATGEQLWQQAYNYTSTDPDNPSDVTNSVARAVTIDSNNNIYVTGTFDTFLGRIGTIKYNAAGVQQWIETYKSGTEKTQGWQAKINNGVLYVAGSHNGGFSSDGNVLISYGLDGTENWVEETTDLIDAINIKLMFDGSGNPVVAAKGLTPGAEEWSQDNAARVKKYSPAGDLIGQAAFVISSPEGTASMGEMAGIGLDGSGNAYFAVNSFYSADGAVYEVIKSAFGTTSPATAWNTAYTNLGSPAASMLYSFSDNDGNTFSTGTYYKFEDNMLKSNYFVVKHNMLGDVAWEAVYNEENGNLAGGIIGRAGHEGNIFVCLLPEGEGPLTVKKLSPAGAEIWEHEVSLVSPQVYVMETGHDGALYLGGVAYEQETDTHGKFVGVKLNAAGDEVWTGYINSPNAADNLYGVNAGKVTAAGELILTGGYGTGNWTSQDVDLAVVKFNADGSEGWVTPVAVTGSSASGNDLLIANDGSVYTNGFAINNGTGLEDIVTAKISADGTLAWSETFGEAGRKERSYTIRQFSNGDVAVVGYSLAANGDIHNVLVRYDAAGNEVWDFASENMRYYNDFHIDGSDIAYIMDQAIVDPFPHKIYFQPFPVATLITVDASGNGDEEFLVGPEYAEFYGGQLIPHTDDRLLLGGSISNQAFFEGLYFFERTHDGSLGTGSFEPGRADINNLGQNYPNPVSGSTTIPFHLVNGGKVSIKLYNMQSRLVKEIANGNYDSGDNIVSFDVSGIAPGIYFYQITAGRFKQTRKMIITK
jgi:hypothetical protein